MSRRDFELSLAKMVSSWGPNMFSLERLDLIFPYAEQISAYDFEIICNKFIATSRQAPLPCEIIGEIKVILKSNNYASFDNDTYVDRRMYCDKCCCSGYVIAIDRIGDRVAAYCDCLWSEVQVTHSKMIRPEMVGWMENLAMIGFKMEYMKMSWFIPPKPDEKELDRPWIETIGNKRNSWNCFLNYSHKYWVDLGNNLMESQSSTI